jgi:putative DNA methylase
MDHPIISPKKLIEVALPLDAINVASAREKSIRHGHPSTLHLWWARRPLAAARAVIFAQMVNDPSWKWEIDNPGQTPPGHLKASWAASRKRLFGILEDLVRWENTTNEVVLDKARSEIRKSWREVCALNSKHPNASELFDPDKIPGVHDPFAGGGAIPLEAQRLGLNAFASDLNPVAVLINKAMIEIPPKFAGRAPVNEESRLDKRLLARQWQSAQGLADDIRYYGKWISDEAQKRIGHLYPPIKITKQMGKDRPDLRSLEGQTLTVIAWLWARTVKSPNPAFSHVDVPLAPSFVLSSRDGSEAYVKPIVKGDQYTFTIKSGAAPEALKKGTKASGRGAEFRCLLSDAPISGEYIKNEGRAGRMSQRLMAVVAQGPDCRVYLAPTEEMEVVARSAAPSWKPDIEFFQKALGFRIGNYGMSRWSELFSDRQLVALSTFCELVREARQKIHDDAISAGMLNGSEGLERGGDGAKAYSEAVSVFLAFAVSRAADYWGRGAIWESGGMFIAHVFTRNALPMTWDFPEANPFSDGSGGWSGTCVDWVARYIDGIGAYVRGSAVQADAQSQTVSRDKVVSTDPPYFDNIGYADLSDYFYVWLRASLREVFPTLLATMTVPKSEELVATPERHGGKLQAEQFFLAGMTQAMRNIASLCHPAFPITIYYAFKQAETSNTEGTTSTGWETFLDAVNSAGFSLQGTWPMRTERPGRMRDNASNALASSIILVCRRRHLEAPSVSRREFLRELNRVLPEALDEMTRGTGDEQSPVAPVDLSQAIIGPGMAVFSKYSAVLEADGTPMTVRAAMQLINRFLAEDDFDADTQFCLHWFEQFGWEIGRFGEADTLARAKGTSVDGVKQAGVLHAVGGSVRLLKWAEYPSDWDPKSDQRLPVWEVLHQLIRVFNNDGETGAAAVFAAVQSKAEAARQLAYRLYTLCERKNWAEDARAYNELVTSWSGIETAASKEPSLIQRELFDN